MEDSSTYNYSFHGDHMEAITIDSPRSACLAGFSCWADEQSAAAESYPYYKEVTEGISGRELGRARLLPPLLVVLRSLGKWLGESIREARRRLGGETEGVWRRLVLRKPSYYDAKIAALSAKKYKREGPGDLYVVACVPNPVLTNCKKRRITFDQLTLDTKLKLGHTNNLCRRRSQYAICDSQQTHIWLCAYRVKRRYLAERLVHLSLLRSGCKRAGGQCPGCSAFHREYFEYSSVGGVVGLEKRVLTSLGECLVRRNLDA
ncbi:hypothetical protein R3P38DRAFT_2802333 [Favolaschia claudopus]|uniref:Bacteriophage T5 Orf172 DNA-binding domain-containing protein n=1 Tax=Favolaschia claudopus TaxID=2862362 RepID=A0AAV9ZVQ4_9AGAR